MALKNGSSKLVHNHGVTPQLVSSHWHVDHVDRVSCVWGIALFCYVPSKCQYVKQKKNKGQEHLETIFPQWTEW
jgi:hypothetical protein